MSATVTENPVTSTIQQDYLHDYQIRLTGGSRKRSPEATKTRRRQQPSTRPAGTTSTVRPVNRNLDLADRPWGSNGVESAFVFLMLNGCWLQGVTNWLWRTTGGRVNKDYFRFKVGGEI
ncbi:hypothetical protein ColLi_11024 [Colletotrichum liriopes]|uniref:Uncharacterized protein n=1 Tax=Colletotrichum liriopes TaxID=708192 RepID=A0AA37GVU6_9PEZI|nr:hypothetical protein ColLi_11024 [Colletotrichum liriopes]